MSHIRVSLSAIVLAGLIAASAAFAQAPTSPSVPNVEPTISAPAPEPSTATEVEKWTTEQWDAAKAKWSEERNKWAECQQLATDQKLTGTKSWAFLYRCMT
jgi:hypothetical protein